MFPVTLGATDSQTDDPVVHNVSSFGDSYYYYGRTDSEFFADALDMSATTGWTLAPTAIGYGTGNGHNPTLGGLDDLPAVATVIPDGSGPNQKGARHTWVYFKKNFDLPDDFDVNDIVDASGLHRIDDALIIYLNGTEVYRYNAFSNSGGSTSDIRIGGPINWSSYVGYNSDATTRDFAINSEYSMRDTGFQSTSSNSPHLLDAGSFANLKEALEPGNNIITCAVGNNSSGSSDLWFDLEFDITTDANQPASDAVSYDLSAFGDSYWYYGRTNSEFFADALDMSATTGWTLAPTAIGFGTANQGLTLATTIPTGSDSSQRGNPSLHTWMYTKKAFNLPDDFDAEEITDVSGIHRIDDALVILVNGVQVYRYNTNDNSKEVMSDAINWGVYTGRNTDAENRNFNINSNYNSHDTGYRGTSTPNELYDAASLTALKGALKPGDNVLTCVTGQRSDGSSDLWFDLQLSITTGTLGESDDISLTPSYLTLHPGSDSSKLNFSWQTEARATSPVVRIWKEGSDAMDFSGTAGASANSISSLYFNRVTVTGLEANTTYLYKLGNGSGGWSDTYTTKTQSANQTFSYMVFGDPQVSSQAYGNNWKNVVDKAIETAPGFAFMASTGDNIDSNTKAQYDYLFTPKESLASVPFATCMGNHEGSGTAPREFFNPPNADSDQNFWYRYGDTLFMVWNCTTGSTTSMRTFLTNAINQNKDAKWRILNFHYDVYGQGSAHALSDGKSYRDSYVSVIDDFDIDVVFNGHDHSYSRSYPMKWSGSAATSNSEGMQPETFAPGGESINPKGTVYFSLNSASGQKHYDLVAKQPYTAFMDQKDLTNFSIVDMTDNTFTCTTYQINANNSLTEIDSYTILKVPEVAPAITSVNFAAFAQGTGGSFEVTATGYPEPSLSLIGAPAGVTINADTGLMTIADTVDAGIYSFIITAANGVSPDAIQIFTLTVNAAPIIPSELYPVVMHFGIWKGIGTKSGVIDAPKAKFSHLLYKGTVVDPANYAVTEGSTIITLTEAYLMTLTDGIHLFNGIYTDGASEAIVLVIDPLDGNTGGNNAGSTNPGTTNSNTSATNNSTNVDDGNTDEFELADTGDTTKIFIWLILVVAGLSAVGFVTTLGDRKHEQS